MKKWKELYNLLWALDNLARNKKHIVKEGKDRNNRWCRKRAQKALPPAHPRQHRPEWRSHPWYREIKDRYWGSTSINLGRRAVAFQDSVRSMSQQWMFYCVRRTLALCLGSEVRGSIPPFSTSLPSLFGWDVKPRNCLCMHAFYQTQTKKILTFTA